MSFAPLVAAAVLSTALLAQQPTRPTAPPAPQEPATRPAVLYSTRGDQRVHMLSLPDLKPLWAYEAGAGAHELAISADGRWAIGSAYGGPGPGHEPADNRVFVLDLPSGLRSRTIDLGASKRPNDLAFLGTTSVAVVTTEQPPQLLRLDALTGEFEAFALEHPANHMLALAGDGSACFVSHVLPGGVTRFDLTKNEVTKFNGLPVGAEGICCVGEGAAMRLWIACNRTDRLLVVDANTLKVEHSVARGGFPLRVKASPHGTYVAVSCPKTRTVVVYDAKDVSKAQTVDLSQATTADQQPTSLAWAPDNGTLLVMANGEMDRIVTIDALTAKTIGYSIADGPIADALVAGMVLPPPPKR